LSEYLTALRFVQGRQQSERFNTDLSEDLVVFKIEYPGPPLNIEFYRYPSDTKPLIPLEFPKPWACLRMLRQNYYNQKKGYIRLNIKDKENLGGILYLQLEFFKDSDCKKPVDENFIEVMTGS
jgi:hypothetical protein